MLINEEESADYEMEEKVENELNFMRCKIEVKSRLCKQKKTEVQEFE